ncbi:hypothetical protein [Arthrobacter mangrovi]|uniref:Uncharacterized protein n=1 Tax=Arthrobacter mangrovi TaxID=2966350 RepID=A0ABQ5MT07_9MICC|nr:hypothetical protein [Arthrobacter mangrovi]GLB67096.1 hypothetical protein AHIS1636_15350 [Arthrobacter mangrovi]
MAAFPHKEPRTEAFASVHTGEQLEQLSGIAARQPYVSQGPWLTAGSLQLLQTAAESGRLGRFGIAGKAAELDQLVSAGLLTDKGKLTGQGRLVTSPWRDSVASLRIAAQFGGRASVFQAWLGPEGCLVLAGPSYDRFLAGNSQAGHQLDFLALGHLYPAIAAWVGIAPAWSLASEPLSIDLQTVNRRFGGETVPVPEGADPVLVNMWRQPWFIWQLLVEPESGHPETFINAGESGHYHLAVAEDRAQLNARPSGALYRDLARAIDRAVHR